MTLIMVPVFEKGHEPSAVGQWTLEELSWWFLIRSKRIKAKADAQEEAEKAYDRR